MLFKAFIIVWLITSGIQIMEIKFYLEEILDKLDKTC